MRKILTLFTALAFLSFAAVAQDNNNDVIGFEKTAHNFGEVPQGTPVTYEFTFTNTQNTPIIIEHVESTCGCTVPKWTNSPVAPGQKGIVAAEYNAARPGIFKKPVTVRYNAGGQVHTVKLYLEGEVAPKEQ